MTLLLNPSLVKLSNILRPLNLPSINFETPRVFQKIIDTPYFTSKIMMSMTMF